MSRALRVAVCLCVCTLLASCGFQVGQSEAPTSSAAPKPTVQYEAEDLGIAYPHSYGGDAFARNMWDMQSYGGKVYFGGGDYDRNLGPCDLLCYDGTSGEVARVAELQDEQIGRFCIIDGQLVLPTTDQIGSGSGGYFRLESGGWQTYRCLDGALHCFDMAEYADAYFAAVGLKTDDNDHSAIRRSTDGVHFDDVYLYRDGRRVTVEKGQYGRCYELFVYKMELYAYYRASAYDYYAGVYRYDIEKDRFDFIGSSFLPINCRNSQENYLTVQAKFEFGGEMVFVNNQVLCTDDMQCYRTVALPAGAVARDGLVLGGKLYILAAAQQADGTYKNMVLVGDSAERLDTIIVFDAPSYCVSFEYCEGYFLFALGTSRTQLSGECGRLMRIAYKL